MNRKSLILSCLLLSLLLSGCQNADMPEQPSASIIALETGVWPANEYTAGIPTPPGTVSRAAIDSAHDLCSIWLEDFTGAEFDEYIIRLEEAGFETLQSASEEIKGEGYESFNLLLSNGQTGLSIAHTPGLMGIVISPNP